MYSGIITDAARAFPEAAVPSAEVPAPGRNVPAQRRPPQKAPSFGRFVHRKSRLDHPLQTGPPITALYRIWGRKPHHP